MVRLILGVGTFLVIIVALALLLPQIRGSLGSLIPLLRPAPDLVEGEPLPFTLPASYRAVTFAQDLPGVRVIAKDGNGTLIVSLPSEGRVVALPDTDGDHIADRHVVVLQDLRRPHGIALDCTDGTACTLYVAEENAVRSYRYDPETFTATRMEKIADLPSSGGHSTRTLLLSPDKKSLLVSVGSSCNVCHEESDERAAVLSIDLLTKAKSIFARGLRNTVFMTFHPVTGAIWGTDMGRDLLGDDTPPDEVNIISRDGNFGWPICYGKNIHDSAFDKNTYIRNPCMEPFEKGSHIDIPAHSAPLGLAFIPDEGWPDEYRFDLLVSYHGSWNRSVPTGYKIVRIDLDEEGRPTGTVEDFMAGFVSADGEIIGRPVDLLIEPGGVLYVSDDRAGAIYRVSK